MFLDLDDVKQAVQLNPATLQRPNCLPPIVASGKQSRPASPSSEDAARLVPCNQDHDDKCAGEGNISVSEKSGREETVVIDTNISSSTRRLNSVSDPHKGKSAPLGQNPLQLSRRVPLKKPTSAINTQNQDTSIERLIREVTNEKLWKQSGTNY